MKTITASKAGLKKIRQGEMRLAGADLLDLSKSFVPGEWVQVRESVDGAGDCYLGFVHLFAQQGRQQPALSLVKKSERPVPAEEDECKKGLETVMELLELSLSRRKAFKSYQDAGRWVYGGNDRLPGLNVDKYENCLLIRITTAGIDRYRQNISEFFKNYCPKLDIIIHDDAELRKEEGLPIFSRAEEAHEDRRDPIVVKENGFTLKVSRERFQKTGHYYDHRENRAKFERILSGFAGKLERGLDLFCYVGSWGMHQMRAGVEMVAFVDQGNFNEELEGQIRDNGLLGKFAFERSDVWAYLDRAIAEGKSFDVITSDPPAFCKSFQEKEGALRGYLKLHQKVLRVAAKGAIVAINSCTKYVSFNELDKTVQQAALREGKSLSLIDIGLQAPDHPMRSLEDRSHYLKYLAYWVEG